MNGPRISLAPCGVSLLLATMAVLVCVSRGADVVSAQGTPKLDFARDIQPLLKESCYGCHGPAQQLGGFRFDQRSSVRKVRGRLQAGSSATSTVYLRVSGTEFGPQMPPTGALQAEQIAVIKDWIDQGAPWPDELAGDDAAPPPPDPTATRLIETLRGGDRQSFATIISEQPHAIDRRAAGGATPLMYAASYADATAVRSLLDRGADVNAANEAGATALMWAVGDEHVTRLLLDYGADVNAMSLQGQTPLSIAAGRFGSSTVVKLLLDYGASPAMPAGPGAVQSSSGIGLALIRAADSGDAAVFRMLVQRGADLKAAGALGLVLAARSNCGTCVEMLLAAVPQAGLNRALVALAPIGDQPLLARLIDRGADVNARLTNVRRDMAGRTPLMLAASSDRIPIEVVRMLIARGADSNARGPAGETALDLARRHGETVVVDALLEAGATPGRGFPTATVTAKPAASVQAALERTIPLLQRSDVTFVQKAGCLSCHNNTLTAMTLATARAHRVPLDEGIAREQRKAISAVVEGRRDLSLLGSEIAITAGNILTSLAADDYAADITTDAMASFLKGRQMADGRWRDVFVDHRPPIQTSDIDVTAVAIRALRVYAPKQRRAEYDTAIQRGITWLLGVEPRTTDGRALQLLGLMWGGVDPKHEGVRAAARALLAEQRSDGGWGQLPTLASDAYAAGQAMVALKESGALGVTDAAYQRGVRYLLTTQLEDGSWYVKTRSLAFQPYFESGFPHGPDQWISMAASNWAAMALALAAPPK